MTAKVRDRLLTGVIVLAVLALLAIASLASASGPAPCCTQSAIMRAAALKTVNSSGRPGTLPILEAGLNAAYGPCSWLSGAYRCKAER